MRGPTRSQAVVVINQDPARTTVFRRDHVESSVEIDVRHAHGMGRIHAHVDDVLGPQIGNGSAAGVLEPAYVTTDFRGREDDIGQTVAVHVGDGDCRIGRPAGCEGEAGPGPCQDVGGAGAAHPHAPDDNVEAAVFVQVGNRQTVQAQAGVDLS